MSDATSIELLREALALLNDGPNFSMRNDRRKTSYKLAARIDAFLAKGAPSIATDEMVREVRARWGHDAAVRIDDRTALRGDADGLWVGAWLRAGAPIAPIDTKAYERALASLPPLTREVFLLNRRDGLSYAVIGERLGLSPTDVETAFTAALTGLHRGVFGGGG